ncbi:hypothetical protein I4F81_012335 [Pyropia yezoensis]|uniref:Uncharacterized protein n=1 Tax=Pyropia yezoensis TaxID=2788 RepID=A0ACC3CIU3_PYRYE|nr:hypothetical protein I4F81_012335 [Neopyropia yezoensis]
MGFCVGWLEAAADGALCTVDWARADRDGGGRQCCFRARRRWVAAAAATTTGGGGGGGGGASGLVTACRSAKVPRLVLTPRVKPGGVPFCGPREFGTPALCCLRKKNYWERARCCAKCRGPAVHGKSNGCCWPGKPPKGGKKAPAKQKPAPRRTWRSGRHL